MLNLNFGHYLMNKGLLMPVQLCEVFKNAQSVTVKLGILAVNAGLMTAAQVEAVHNLQRVKDEKFGILAVSQGYLTYEQLEALLASQEKGQLSLMQVIVDEGYMTLAAVEQALANYRQEYGITEQDINDECKVINKLLDFSAAGDNADILAVYVGLTLRNIVRFLDDTPYVLAQPPEQTATCLVSQRIHGEIALGTGLSMDETVLLAIASRFYGERLTVVDELALDSVGEFLNVHNGVFCSSLSDVGVQIDLEPQCVQRGKICHDDQSFHVGIGTSFGQFELILTL